MKKYGIIQLDGVSSTARDQFCANGIALVNKSSSDDVRILYESGKIVDIASAAALTDADAKVVFEAIVRASKTKWTETSFLIPKLSQPVNSVQAI
jgi:hypothetical protein